MEYLNDALELDIGQSLKALRARRGMTIDQLAASSGVSRAMISKIERGEASPTAVLLSRLLGPLEETLSGFFAPAGATPSPFSSFSGQPVWQDPETGYRRRAVSPPGPGMHVDLVDVTLPAGARVALPPAPAEPPQRQYVWLLEGKLTMECDGAQHDLSAGDCLYMTLNSPITFHNRSDRHCRYAVVLKKG